jgi:transcriptional regulator with XRE-family HTH domain
MTQAELAEHLAISQQTVTYYERRATNPSLGFIEKVAEALGIAVVDLVGDSPPRKEPRKKPGPKSQLEKRFDHVRHLSRTKQDLVARMIDAVLDDERHPA